MVSLLILLSFSLLFNIIFFLTLSLFSSCQSFSLSLTLAVYVLILHQSHFFCLSLYPCFYLLPSLFFSLPSLPVSTFFIFFFPSLHLSVSYVFLILLSPFPLCLYINLPHCFLSHNSCLLSFIILLFALPDYPYLYLMPYIFSHSIPVFYLTCTLFFPLSLTCAEIMSSPEVSVTRITTFGESTTVSSYNSIVSMALFTSSPCSSEFVTVVFLMS